MSREKLFLSVLMICFGFITSCAQNEPVNDQTTKPTEKKQATHADLHPYGGWYCPDNLGGFPPVNVQGLAKVPVVNGRMPTQAETRNGASLMYFDPAEYPTAKPLNMTLPKLARYYSPHTKLHELVIVIQAVVLEKDTVVGFRYLNGGNGTSWFSEVRFLSDKEVAELGSTPFVFLEAEIKASKEKIWAAIAGTAYAKKLGEHFDEKAFFESAWTPDSRVDLRYESDAEKSTGIIMTLFGNLYIQIDYDYKGYHYVEKVLVMEHEDGKSAKIQIVSGPYKKDFEQEEAVCKKWLQEVKTMSEKK